mgnify:CR=1 FL=1
MNHQVSSGPGDVAGTVKALYEYVISELLYDVDQDSVAPEDELLGTGLLDSMAATQLMQHVETVYAVEFEPDDLTFDNFNTLPALASLIALRTGK